jgi:hypothetical protein
MYLARSRQPSYHNKLTVGNKSKRAAVNSETRCYPVGSLAQKFVTQTIITFAAPKFDGIWTVDFGFLDQRVGMQDVVESRPFRMMLEFGPTFKQLETTL